jgi:hypothetical protein
VKGRITNPREEDVTVSFIQSKVTTKENENKEQ